MKSFLYIFFTFMRLIKTRISNMRFETRDVQNPIKKMKIQKKMIISL